MPHQEKPHPFEKLTVEIGGKPYRLFREDGVPQFYHKDVGREHPEHFNVRHYCPADDYATLKLANALYETIHSQGRDDGLYHGKEQMEHQLQRVWRNATLRERLSAVFSKTLPTKNQPEKEPLLKRLAAAVSFGQI